MQNTQAFNFGAVWNKRCNKWQSQYTIENKKIYLGLFDTEQEAQEAYKEAINEKARRI